MLSLTVDPTPKFSGGQLALFQSLIELLSFAIRNQSQNNRALYFILSNPISRKIVSLLHVKNKPLRHGELSFAIPVKRLLNQASAAMRFIRACLRTPNHFIHRYFTKNDLLSPFIDLLEEESGRDNMLSSACMDILDLIRKVSVIDINRCISEACIRIGKY